MGASASSRPTPRDGGAPWPEGRITPPPGLAAEVLSLARGRGAYRALVAALGRRRSAAASLAW